MGNSITPSFIYSSEIGPSESTDHTGIRRAQPGQKTLLDNVLSDPLQNAWDIFLKGKSRDPNAKCMGSRIPLPDMRFGEYKWLTYAQVEQAALSIGSFLSALIPTNEYSDENYVFARKLQPLGIFSKNCVPWFVCEQAANAYNLTLVPFFSSLKSEATAFIFKQTRLSVVAGSVEALNDFLKNPTVIAFLKHFIVFDDIIPDLTRTMASAAKIHLYKYTDLIQSIKNLKPCRPGKLVSVSTLCYTSGTTGNPKAVIITHGNIVATLTGILEGPLNEQAKSFKITSKDTHFSYLPAAHVFERSISNLMLYIGASIGVYSGEITKLLDDAALLKPTIFISVPRLFNRIHDRIFAKTKEKSALAQKIFNAGMSTKLKQYRQDCSLYNKFYNNIVFNKIKDLLGGELRYFIVGGAPLSESIQEKIAVLFSTPLVQGYGLTETFGTSFICHRSDPTPGHVGGPLSCLEFKLESVPELQYLVQSEQPMGEIVLRGPCVSPGYFQAPEETEASFDSDGWFHTGDIGLLLPAGSLRIIDRRKNIFKLSQGEYISPEIIELVYMHAAIVFQIFVHGDSMQSSLVAIIVIDPDEAKKWQIKENLTSLSLSEVCKNELFIQKVKNDMEAVSSSLKGYEKVKAFHLTEQQFSEENNLFTPTQKLKRHAAKQYFSSIIDQLYAQTSQ